MNNKLSDYPDVLKPEDLANILGFSLNGIYRMLDAGSLPGVRIGGHWRTLKTKLLEVLEGDWTAAKNVEGPDSSQELPAIGAYVREKMQELLTKGLIKDEEINRLKNKEYCKKAFGIHFPVLKELDSSRPIAEQIRIGKYNRYWKAVFAGKYLICSQWHKGHVDNFQKWLETL